MRQQAVLTQEERREKEMEAKPHQFLTTYEVAQLLGLRSINSVKKHLHRVPTEYVQRTPGNHYRIRVEAVEILRSLAREGGGK
jgi:hypothetical protein